MDSDLPDGYDNVRVPAKGRETENSERIKINVKSRTEFKVWLEELSLKPVDGTN